MDEPFPPEQLRRHAGTILKCKELAYQRFTLVVWRGPIFGRQDLVLSQLAKVLLLTGAGNRLIRHVSRAELIRAF